MLVYPHTIRWHYNDQFWASTYFKKEVCNNKMYDDEEQTILMYVSFQVDHVLESELVTFDHIE
jgi:hypothetical protein